MIDAIVAIVISLMASFIYDSLKKSFENRSVVSSDIQQKFSKKYVATVKKQFYIGFVLGILFTIVPETDYQFVNLFFRIMSYFMFFIALMGFMCAVEIINHFSDKDTDDN